MKHLSKPWRRGLAGAPALALALALALLAPAARAGVVVIGHPELPKVDARTLQRIYLGQAIEVGGVVVTAVNARAASVLRARFLQAYLERDEEKYTAYWTVRRYLGKGAPPIELAGGADVIGFVQATPGAIAYIDDSELRPGLNVLLRR